ncbi:hypothetical protein ACFFJY_00120 [Fictibacillus aquaticus]|uniref:Uncharacterized protein n=1 Tax=Fictibacillus aquaticus TaxID=2021314 RepID=A0A235F766_9BACL|nr:hypothetical protein [Fictibacillus aquaticus]OYD57140.1 hypothetical protein CGZ90_10605 [Fictibacillus aquaticus]
MLVLYDAEKFTVVSRETLYMACEQLLEEDNDEKDCEASLPAVLFYVQVNEASSCFLGKENL